MVKKIFLTGLLVFMLATVVHAAFTTSIGNRKTYKNSYRWTGKPRDKLLDWAEEVEGLLDGSSAIDNILFSERSSDPTSTEGRLYYNTTSNVLKYHNGTSFQTLAAESGTVSLDTAYNNGNSIDVDGTAVTFTVSDTDNNAALVVAQNDSTNDPDAMNITSAADAGTAVGLQIDCTAGFDVQGTGDAWNVSIAGVFNGESLTGLTNAQGIIFDTNNEIQFGDNSEDVAMVFTSNTLTWATDTGVNTMAMGVLDTISGMTAITGDAADLTISITADAGGEDLLIQQAGGVDGSVHVASAGTGADAISLITSAGGIDITVAGAAAGEDLDLLTDSSVTIRSSEASVDDAITIETTGAGSGMRIISLADIDITTTGTAGEDISIINTGGTVIVTGTEDATDAIDINATAGGIDIDATGEAGQDIVITNTGGSMILNATEDIADGIFINATTGGIDITADGAVAKDLDLVCTNGSTNMSAGEDIATAIFINATTGGIDITADGAAAKDLDLVCTNGSTNISGGEAIADAVTIAAGAGGVDISAAATFDIDITATGGRILSVATETVADQFKVDAQGIVVGDAINFETTDGGIMLNADGGTNGDIELNSADALIFTAAGAMTVDITGAGTYKGSWLPDSVVTTTETTTTLDTTDIGKITKVTADAQTITLPATVVGYFFTIFYDGADGGALITIELDNNDQFLGADIAGAPGEALLLTKATSDKGDYVRLIGDGVDGWKIMEMNGIWAEATP